jgi:hypothetical protein
MSGASAADFVEPNPDPASGMFEWPFGFLFVAAECMVPSL